MTENMPACRFSPTDYCEIPTYDVLPRHERIIYNNSLRRLLGILRHIRTTEMFVQLIVKAFLELMRKYIQCYRQRWAV